MFSLSELKNNTKIQFSSLVDGLLFRYMGRLVTNQQKYNFSLFSATFLLAVWFCIYMHVQLRILKFQDFVYQKDHKQVKENET